MNKIEVIEAKSKSVNIMDLEPGQLGFVDYFGKKRVVMRLFISPFSSEKNYPVPVAVILEDGDTFSSKELIVTPIQKGSSINLVVE